MITLLLNIEGQFKAKFRSYSSYKEKKIRSSVKNKETVFTEFLGGAGRIKIKN
jgi:hypothetical protein